MGFAVNFFKGDTNGKEKEIKGTVEQTGFEPSQAALSRNRHVQSRKEAASQDRRRKKEGVQNGT
jgi:hypothetical protein